MIQARKSLLLGAGVALGGVLAAAPLTAQQTACSIDETASKELAMVQLALGRGASSTISPPDRARSLRDAVKRLTDKPQENAAAKSLLLGRTLMLWATQPGIGTTATRGELGFSSGKDQRVEILAAADTAFTAVETAMPECRAVVAAAREAEPWLGTVQAALAALSASQLDSAEALARRSLVINRESPYAYHVLANVARQRKDTPAAIGYWQKAIETSRGDTSAAVVRQRAYYDLGVTASDAAMQGSGADRQARSKEAIEAFRAYLAEAPTSSDAPVVQTRLANLLTAVGDTSAVAAIYADQLANPTRYGDIALTQAGVIAWRANRVADAAKLYEAALAANPNQRDALSNLAATYHDLGRPADMLDVSKRLVTVDPSNPDNWLFFAYAYQGLARGTKDQKLVRAYTDSLLKYKAKSDSLPVKVSFTRFSREEAKTTLVASVENRSTAPKTYQLKVEFLDRAGNVVATQEASVAVAPKESKQVTIAVDKGGIVGFRYSPLS